MIIRGLSDKMLFDQMHRVLMLSIWETIGLRAGAAAATSNDTEQP
jgi:hypothetical protein